jgi:hypothetical protein
VLPLDQWLHPQARFAHLLRPENAELLETLRRQVEHEWLELVRRCDTDAAAA